MSRTRILIIEDQPLNMELVADLLEVAGYAVLQAADAETGIEVARREHPAVIVLDIGLPGMDGLAAAEVLHDDRSTASIPIVVMSAHAMARDEQRARAAGCVAYITKPIDTRTFLPTIAGVLRSTR